MFHVLLFVLLTARISADNPNEEENVLILNTSNFDKALKENEYVLVHFYAPWCGHCKRIASEYSKAATQLKKEGSSTKLATVDATVELQIADRFQITEYPTFTFFTNGTAAEYTGGRTLQDLVNWVKKKTGPAARVLKNKEAVAKLKEEAEIVVIGFFKNQESKNAKVFLEVAKKFDDQLFGITSDDAIFADYFVKKDAIILFDKPEDGRSIFRGEFNETAITSFIHENQLPLVVELNEDVTKKLFTSEVKKHVTLFLKKEGNDKIITEFSEVAKEFKGEFLFIYVDTAAEDNIRIVEFFQLSQESPPSLRIVTFFDGMKRYIPASEGVDKTAIRKLVQDYFDGNTKRHLVSEDIPEGWDTKPVKVLVGKTFNDVVFNKDKAVFVQFVAPWCHHCKHLTPILENLANSYTDDDNVVVAQIDSTINELEDVKIIIFPTYKYFPRGSNQIIDYNGKQTFEAFKTFLDSDGKEIIPEEEKVETNEGKGDEEKGTQEEKKEAELEKKDTKEEKKEAVLEDKDTKEEKKEAALEDKDTKEEKKEAALEDKDTKDEKNDVKKKVKVEL